MAEAILGRRTARADRHVRFAGAGHLIRLGVLPTDALWTGGIALGGERAPQAAAQRAAIAEVLSFLAAVTPTPTPASGGWGLGDPGGCSTGGGGEGLRVGRP